MTLIRSYQALAAAGKEIVRTDVPAELLPAFVDLGARVKDAGGLRSIAFVSSPSFVPGDPDFDWLRAAVQRALVAKARPQPGRPEAPALHDRLCRADPGRCPTRRRSGRGCRQLRVRPARSDPRSPV